MAKFTVAQIEEHAKKIMENFEDGFQFSDFFSLVPEALAIVQDVGEMGDVEKEEAVLAVVGYIIDNTDTPWLPDDLVDPILKKGAKYLLDQLLKDKDE